MILVKVLLTTWLPWQQVKSKNNIFIFIYLVLEDSFFLILSYGLYEMLLMKAKNFSAHKSATYSDICD